MLFVAVCIAATPSHAEEGATPAVDVTPCALPCVENFDDGAFDHASLSGLWHVSAACARPRSRPNHLAYNVDSTCTYETGRTANKGEARFVVDLSGVETASLRYQELFETEGNLSRHDMMTIDASVDGDTWTKLIDASYRARPVMWRTVVFDLSPFAGQPRVTIRWAFDSVDELFNGFLGWVIDDVRVDSTPACGNNDARAAACVIDASPYANHQWTGGFTEETGEIPACGVGIGTAWYRYRHRGNERLVTVDPSGSTFDTVVAVYHNGVPIACADDAVDGFDIRTQADLTFLALPGRAYDIQIGRRGTHGSLLVEVR